MKDRYLEISNVASAHLYFSMAAAPASANTTRTFCTKMHVVTPTMTEAVYSRTSCTNSLEYNTLCNGSPDFRFFLPEGCQVGRSLLNKEVHDEMLTVAFKQLVPPHQKRTTELSVIDPAQGNIGSDTDKRDAKGGRERQRQSSHVCGSLLP
jgi:hypothetical protein